MPMTDADRLAEIRAREQHATQAPWRHDPPGTVGESVFTVVDEEWMAFDKAEAEVRAADASLQRIANCLKAIREKHGKERGLAGEMGCP